MNTFKNKRYWILMPPSLLISISLIIFIPENKGILYAFVVIALFWIVYYTWTYYVKKNSRNKSDSL
ncbi:hypothetical protein [Oceanobacillus oncorhynchi]|uniref:hypothetical protein n=1 Tax=Oceanobacillus oncorhynchi TaxID=545501 RepID=UPI0034D78BDD